MVGHLDCCHYQLIDLHPIFDTIQCALFTMGQRYPHHQHCGANSDHIPIRGTMGHLVVLGHFQCDLVVLGVVSPKWGFDHGSHVGIQTHQCLLWLVHLEKIGQSTNQIGIRTLLPL